VTVTLDAAAPLRLASALGSGVLSLAPLPHPRVATYSVNCWPSCGRTLWMTSAQNYRWVALPSAEGSIRCGCTRSSPTPTGARHEQFAEARHQGIREGVAAPADRAGRDDRVGQAVRHPGGRDLRGACRRRQRWLDQTHRPTRQPPDLPDRGIAGADRARTHAVVLPALRLEPAVRRRDRAV